MKRILVLGAGFSAPYLIDHLLGLAEERDWWITVGDLDVERARQAVHAHKRGGAIRFDVTDSAMRNRWISEADVVVSMLSPAFHSLVAIECIEHGVSLVTASYVTQELRALENDALRKGVLILGEMGLDPGIDHMSAMGLIDGVHQRGGQVREFRSYGSGIPAPDSPQNPLRYYVTWNPSNVVLAGSDGAQYLASERVKVVPHHEVFRHTWPVEVDGMGTLEAYPNRDSLTYLESFGVDRVDTMIRGTLRYPGWCDIWYHVVRLGLANDAIDIPNLSSRTYRELTEMLLPATGSAESLEQRLAAYLRISPTGETMEKLRWLGLFEDRKVPIERGTMARAMTALLSEKLALPEGATDTVILQHEIVAEFEKEGRRERIVSSMVQNGEVGGFTAMARTVGAPAAMAVRLILSETIGLKGVHIPTHPAIYGPVMKELDKLGLRFEEKTTVLDD